MDSSPLQLDDIRSTLATRCVGQHIHLFDTLASTNSAAMTLAQSGAAHGTVVVAESQTAGRGRHARSWFSPSGKNLYCSIIARGIGSTLPLSDWLSWIPLTTALAVAETVQEVAAVSLNLKWPNDLLLDDRKVGGILCESALSPSNDPIVVIGIGVNVNVPHDSFPDDLRPIATSLVAATGQPVDRNRLLAHLCLELEQGLEELRTQGASRLRQAYGRRCATLGRQVRVLLNEREDLFGRAESIGADGALQVRSTEPSSRASLIDVRAADIVHLR
ncbi:MAG: biotin--[acetyl-CoA-carboxylase] ligase [Nitrospira sp.]